MRSYGGWAAEAERIDWQCESESKGSSLVAAIRASGVGGILRVHALHNAQ